MRPANTDLRLLGGGADLLANAAERGAAAAAHAAGVRSVGVCKEIAALRARARRANNNTNIRENQGCIILFLADISTDCLKRCEKHGRLV